MHIGMSNTFNLLVQESHLTKNTLLSSFDLLLKANFFQDKEGFFYSAFFHLTIGLERLMKLVVISDHMLKHNYSAPNKKELKVYGHDLISLYNYTFSLVNEYLNYSFIFPERGSSESDLLIFLDKYSQTSRYFNLNELNKSSTKEKSPLEDWLNVSNKVYEENVSSEKREKAALKLIYNLDNSKFGNSYTDLHDFDDQLMTVFDIYHRQLLIQKSTPIIIWKIIEMFRPVYYLLGKITKKASEYEVNNNIKLMVIPHFEDFFYFFLSNRTDTLKRKRWLVTFNR